MTDIASRVRAVIAEQADQPLDAVMDETELRDLVPDSLGRYELAAKLEEEFAISIDDRLARCWTTVHHVIWSVEQKAGPAEPVVAFAGPVSRALP